MTLPNPTLVRSFNDRKNIIKYECIFVKNFYDSRYRFVASRGSG